MKQKNTLHANRIQPVTHIMQRGITLASIRWLLEVSHVAVQQMKKSHANMSGGMYAG